MTTKDSMTKDGFCYAMLGSIRPSERLSVSCVNHRLIPVGEDGEPDAGNLDWPADEVIEAVASKLAGRPVKVRFLDGGDHPTDPEAIYSVTPTVRIRDFESGDEHDVAATTPCVEAARCLSSDTSLTTVQANTHAIGELREYRKGDRLFIESTDTDRPGGDCIWWLSEVC